MKISSKKLEKITKYKVLSYKKINSTNTLAKELAINGEKEGTLVVATEQTAGKGRLGRTFISKRGGVYFSLILRPKKNNNDALMITVAAAIAAAKAIEDVSGKNCGIKWVNDVYIEGKKVCGILTEGGFDENGNLDYAVLGVGINLFELKNGFPQNLPLAGSVFNKKSMILFKKAKKEQIITIFLRFFDLFYQNLEKKEYITEYKNKSILTGKEITYTQNEKKYSATVVGIDDNARLVVKVEGKTQILSHGEIQIVGMEQLLV